MDARHGGRGRSRKRGAIVAPEALEGRQLLTGSIVDVTSLPSTISIGPMTAGRDGSLWIAEAGRAQGPALARVTANGNRTEVPLPSSDAGYTIGAVAADKLGNTWYTLYDATGSQPTAGKIGKVALNGTVTDYPLTTPQEKPESAVIGPDGNFWVATVGGPNGPSIVQVSATGSLTEFPVTGAKDISWLTSGPNNTLWFVDGTKIGTMTTSGTVTEFKLPAPANGQPIDLSNAQLTVGSDGNVWFLGLGGVSKITPTGQVSTLDAPSTQITSLTEGSDGNLWFSFLPPKTGPLAGGTGALLTRMTTTGQTTILSDTVDNALTPVYRMDADTDAAIWLNEGGGKIGRLSLAGLQSFSPPIIAPYSNIGLTANAAGSISGRVAGFIPNDSSAVMSDFTATINWGDGTSSPGVISTGTTGYNVSGSHTYSSVTKPTQEALTITVSNTNGGAAQIFNAVNVGTPAPTTTTPPSTTVTPPPSAGTTAKTRLQALRAQKAQAHAALVKHPLVKAAHPKGPAVHAVKSSAHPLKRKK